MLRLILFIAVFLSVLANAAQAQDYQRVETELETGATLNLTVFPGDGEDLVIWIPSERGIQPPSIPISMNMATEGIDVWTVDLHGSYMVPRNRRSFESFEEADVMALLDKAVSDGFGRVMMISSGRGAPFVLRAGRQWQDKSANARALVGYSFFTPHLLDGQPEMGAEARYLPITYATNLPVYLLQPEFSTKYARTREIAEALKSGGSKVFVQIFKGAVGGFHARPDEDLKDIDFAARERLPTLLTNMMKLMARMPHPETVAGLSQEPPKGSKAKRVFREPRLHPFKGDPTPPKTILEELNGEAFDLASTRGEVVLVNFWATWCGPCVEEIPSLRRLVDRLEGKPFRVVAVNIGEPKEVIDEFIKEIHVNFPILLDKSGNSVRDWNVYAYPSNYLIDKQGQIRYAYRGALEWDADSIVKTIEDTLAE